MVAQNTVTRTVWMDNIFKLCKKEMSQIFRAKKWEWFHLLSISLPTNILRTTDDEKYSPLVWQRDSKAVAAAAGCLAACPCQRRNVKYYPEIWQLAGMGMKYAAVASALLFYWPAA